MQEPTTGQANPGMRLMWSLIRFHPDSCNGELVNIGIVVRLNTLHSLGLVEDRSRALNIATGIVNHRKVVDAVFEMVTSWRAEIVQNADEEWMEEFRNFYTSTIQLSEPAPVFWFESGSDEIVLRQCSEMLAKRMLYGKVNWLL